MDIQWHDVSGWSAPDLTDAALRAHLDPETATGRHCPACGSDRHGRPWARLPDGSRPHVSLARCGDVVVTAVAPLRPVGVDVEDVAAVDARWDPDLVLHPGERADSPAERAATWCRKEAILKALGTGLRIPMSRVRCADWPVVDLVAPPGLAAAVVVLPPTAGQSGSGGSSTV